MKVMAINGIPRRNWNPDTLLKNVPDGAELASGQAHLREEQ